MARIFLSHSSQDELETLAIFNWLQENGWDDVFLDRDPKRGIVAGEHWAEALKKAGNRCEAVVFLISSDWIESRHCEAEMRLAYNRDLHIFGVVIKPTKLQGFKATWQLTKLIGAGPKTNLEFNHNGEKKSIQFLTEGLDRLKHGLHQAGLDAHYFPWPPESDNNRSPYPGLKPMEFNDAAIYFGRDAQISNGITALRSMRRNNDKNLFVILGPSGTGKSSFLRAGLLPRLERDDRNFFPLSVIRPELHAISADQNKLENGNLHKFNSGGLASAIHKALLELGDEKITLGDLKSQLIDRENQLTPLLLKIQQLAHKRLKNLNADAPIPTLILPVDQAEELFTPSANNSNQHKEFTNKNTNDEATQFLTLLGNSLRTAQTTGLQLIVAFTIRTDRYEPLQTAHELSDIGSLAFDDLKPLPIHQYRNIITGPAAREKAAGRKIELEDSLIDKLLEDCAQNADPLPLLALTLETLYRNYFQKGMLTLHSHEKLGGIPGVVNTHINKVLDEEKLLPLSEKLHLLHDAFIPWLAGINPTNDQPIRQIAEYKNLPEKSRGLIDRLVDERLLLTYMRDKEKMVEVAHECLLRQWDHLKQWLNEERDNLKLAQDLEQASKQWESRKKNPSWLWDQERLSLAEKLLHKPGYYERLTSCRDFLSTSRQQEDAEREDELAKAKQLAEEQTAKAELQEQLRKEAEVSREKISKRSKVLVMVMVAMLIVLCIAVVFYNKSKNQFIESTSGRLASEGQAEIIGTTPGNDENGLLKLVAAYKLSANKISLSGLENAFLDTMNVQLIVNNDEPVSAVAFSPDGSTLASCENSGTIKLWNSKTGKKIKYIYNKEKNGCNRVYFYRKNSIFIVGNSSIEKIEPDNESSTTTLKSFDGPFYSFAFNIKNKKLALGDYGAANIFDIGMTNENRITIKGFDRFVTALAFNSKGTILAAGEERKPNLILFDTSNSEKLGNPMSIATDGLFFSPDDSLLISKAADSLTLLNVKDGKIIDSESIKDTNSILSVAFNLDSTVFASGGKSKKLKIRDRRGNSLTNDLEGHNDSITSVAFSPIERELLVSGSDDGTIRFWDLKTYDNFFKVPEINFEAIGISPDKRFLVYTPLWDSKTYMIDLANKDSKPLLIACESNDITALTFSSDGTEIIIGTEDGTLQRCDIKNGKLIGARQKISKNRITSISLYKNIMAAGDHAGGLHIWNTDSKTGGGSSSQCGNGAITSLAFSADGKKIITGHENGMLSFCDVKSGEQIGLPLRSFAGPVAFVAFSPDSQLLYSADENYSLRFWDLKTHRPLTQVLSTSSFGGLKGGILGDNIVAFTVNRKGVGFFPAPTIWSELLCQKLTRNMSKKQWDEWVSPDIDYIEQCPGLPIAPDAEPMPNARN